MMRWLLLESDPELITSIQTTFNTSAVIAKVLANRNIVKRETANPFFKPDLSMLHDPFLMMDMDKAVNRVLKNISAGKPILVFGDYDVDGTTGAASLFIALTKFGGNIHYYIPDREKEGYGLSRQGIKHAASLGADLIITCDCGINAFDQVQFSNKNKIDVIITDHHITDEFLPDAYAVLNPKRSDCEYPFKGLCGGGVAFKLITALGNKLNIPLSEFSEILPLITLGTAADIVPIKDENRIIVYHGLQNLFNNSPIGLQALLNLAGLEDSASVGQLVFGIAPRINAAGRLGDANRVVELFTTDDKNKARYLARELDEENKRRQLIQQTVVDDALLMVNAQADLLSENALVLAREGWHHGVVGIVASKIKEAFNRPTVIIALNNGIGKGSARSITGFDLYGAFSECGEYLDGFGGHPMAAGLTIRSEKVEDFKQAFIRFANDRLTQDDLEATLTLDCKMTLQDITPHFMKFLDKLSPYGPGNMRPKFAINNVQVVGVPKVIGKQGEHLRFKIRQGMRTYPAIGFGLSGYYENLITGKPINIACVVEINEWRGNKSIQLNIRDIQVT